MSQRNPEFQRQLWLNWRPSLLAWSLGLSLLILALPFALGGRDLHAHPVGWAAAVELDAAAALGQIRDVRLQLRLLAAQPLHLLTVGLAGQHEAPQHVHGQHHHQAGAGDGRRGLERQPGASAAHLTSRLIECTHGLI